MAVFAGFPAPDGAGLYEGWAASEVRMRMARRKVSAWVETGQARGSLPHSLLRGAREAGPRRIPLVDFARCRPNALACLGSKEGAGRNGK